MRHFTKIEYARKAGISRQTVYKLLKQGKLLAGKTGKLDVTLSPNKEYLSSKLEGKKQVTNHTNVIVIKSDSSKTKGKKESTTNNGEPIDYDPADLTTLSHTSANKLKTIEQIRGIQVKTDKERLELIPREMAQKVFSKLYMIDVNQWRTMGPSLSPEIAAIVGNDDPETMVKISNAIDKEVFTILKQVKRILNDFLEDIKAEKIK